MPPGAKAQDALRRQKEARQKKILLVLAPVLVGLLAWQGPGTFRALTGGDAESPPPPAASSTTPAPPAPPAAPTTAGAPSTAAPAQPPAAPAPSGEPVLTDSDEPSSAGPGQLVSFDRFVGRDPFDPGIEAKPNSGADGGQPDDQPSQGDDGDAGDAGGDGDNPFGEPSPGAGETTPPPAPPPAAAPASAVLDVNGVRETLRVNATFPTADPVFTLAAISAKSVKIGLVTGEFSTGVPTVTVKLGKSVTLVSEPDGLRYIIRLVSVR
jgi:hypothetical protein